MGILVALEKTKNTWSAYSQSLTREQALSDSKITDAAKISAIAI